MTEAAEQGLIALRGDASGEALLHATVIGKAAYVLAALDRDDACVLICLTVRSLAPAIYLIASAREEENAKLLYRAGADPVVTPSVSGGRLMAAAGRQHAVPRYLEDLLSFGHGWTPRRGPYDRKKPALVSPTYRTWLVRSFSGWRAVTSDVHSIVSLTLASRPVMSWYI